MKPLRHQLHNEVCKHVRVQVYEKVRDYICKVEAQTSEQVCIQLYDQVHNQVRNKILDQVWSQVFFKVSNEVRDHKKNLYEFSK